MVRELDMLDGARLSALVVTDEFKVLQRIFESELQKFNTQLLNANPANKEEVLANHALAKAAAQFYQGVVNRINSEVEAYRYSPKLSDKPEDVTENVIDLGEYTKEMPNFFESEGDIL
jgi:hypothetical protein